MKLSDPSHLAAAERIGERAVADAEALIRDAARQANELLPLDDELTVNAAAFAIQAILLRTGAILDVARSIDAIAIAFGVSLAQVTDPATRAAMTIRFGRSMRFAGEARDRDARAEASAAADRPAQA